MLFAPTVDQNAQVEIHVANYHLANMAVVLYQKLSVAPMEFIVAQMDTLVAQEVGYNSELSAYLLVMLNFI